MKINHKQKQKYVYINCLATETYVSRVVRKPVSNTYRQRWNRSAHTFIQIRAFAECIMFILITRFPLEQTLMASLKLYNTYTDVIHLQL